MLKILEVRLTLKHLIIASDYLFYQPSAPRPFYPGPQAGMEISSMPHKFQLDSRTFLRESTLKQRNCMKVVCNRFAHKI